MDITLYKSYLSTKNSYPNKHAYDIAAILNASEAELLQSRIGNGASRLNSDAATILSALQIVGEVKAITRNHCAVHIHKGYYKNLQFTPHTGIILNPRALDLRFLFNNWDSIFSLTEVINDKPQHSIQFFNQHGDAIHKVYTTDKTDMSQWKNIITEYSQTICLPLSLVPEKNTYSPSPSAQLSAQLDTEWRAMTNVHQFFILLKKYNLSRIQVFRAIADDLAYQVSNCALSQILHAVASQQNEIMIFVSNKNCVQIFTGKIQQPISHHNDEQSESWINVCTEQFTLHLLESEIAESWITRKPTVDGFVTSLELFDSQHNQIAQFFGERNEGMKEQDCWQQQIATLAPLHNENNNKDQHQKYKHVKNKLEISANEHL